MIFASGLKYVGVGTTELGWILVFTLLAAFVVFLAIKQPWRTSAEIVAPDVEPLPAAVLSPPPQAGG